MNTEGFKSYQHMIDETMREIAKQPWYGNPPKNRVIKISMQLIILIVYFCLMLVSVMGIIPISWQDVCIAYIANSIAAIAIMTLART